MKSWQMLKRMSWLILWFNLGFTISQAVRGRLWNAYWAYVFMFLIPLSGVVLATLRLRRV